MNQPATVTRTHELKYIKLTAPSDQPEIKQLFRVDELFKGRDLQHWFIDQDDVKYRACANRCGGAYLKLSGSEVNCPKCTALLDAAKRKTQEQADYAKAFEARIEKAVAVARKACPRANIRKARSSKAPNKDGILNDGKRIIFSHVDTGVVGEIDEAIAAFNLKMAPAYRMATPNADYSRMEAKIKDINPMLRLEKVLNGDV